MINCHFLSGKHSKARYSGFSHLEKTLKNHQQKLALIPLPIIIQLLAQAGKTILTDKSINTLEGITYISLWLRQDRLHKMCQLNYQNNLDFAEKFTAVDQDLYFRAQPRGIICHWVASNIPTLAFFSLVMGWLSKNASILKIPPQNKFLILRLIQHVQQTKIAYNHHLYRGEDLTKSLAIVSFQGNNPSCNQQFSRVADCKVIWGGADAVSAITALPQKEHCEIITLGPKYSFGVFDTAFINSRYFETALQKTALDIALFNQVACSSPHVLFFEPSKFSLPEIGFKLQKCFETLPAKLLHQPLPPDTTLKIINTRAFYALDLNKNLITASDLSWTILMNKLTTLEEPIHGKTIFIKQVKNIINDVLPLVTRKIQAVILGIKDKRKKHQFIETATYKGVDRLVSPGQIHEFGLPWDGILVINRLVRWTSLKEKIL